MENIKVRFIHEVGVLLSFRRYWGGNEPDGSDKCPSIGHTYHDARREFERQAKVRVTLREEDFEKPPRDDPRWSMACDACGEHAPETATRQLFLDRIYSSESGHPGPGDAYFVPWMHDGGRCFTRENCSDPRGHLWVVLPNGDVWDSDGRASNCGRKDDRLHRCWVKLGRIEDGNLDVSKSGDTCQAGAGSIASSRTGSEAWHGFLRHGELVTG